MLVLKRMIGEEIVIRIDGEKIATVTLCDRHRGFSRIGITAPSHVTVHRKEVDDIVFGVTDQAAPSDDPFLPQPTDNAA